LQSLTLDRTFGLTGAALAELPRNLQTLRLLGTPNVSDEHLKSLPPNLKTFVSIAHYPVAGFADAGIKNLPEGLETLALDGEYGDSTIKNAPPNLKRLFITSTLFQVTDEGMKHLPKTLQHLDILSSQVTGSAIKNIPKSVHTLGLPDSYKNMNEGQLEHISENVHTLTISARNLNDATIINLPKTVRNVNLIGDVSPKRLEQLSDARRGTKITAETQTEYFVKIDPAFRGEGDLAIK
jgi:hypothetical protein